MRTPPLRSAVIAGILGSFCLAGVSTAVTINPDGVGQVLIYPHYTVNNGMSTVVSIVNTTSDTKAVKVRFLEGRNSQEVLDFNLYLSPFDMWTAAIITGGNEDAAARLVTSDKSCTVPMIPPSGELFFADQYRTITPDAGPQQLARTREGYLEIIEMGRVVDDGDVSTTSGASIGATDPTPGDTGARLATAIQQGANGVPNNCEEVVSSFLSGPWSTNPGADMDTPSGGLTGTASVVNVAAGTSLTYNALALDGFYQVPVGTPGIPHHLHNLPGADEPTLASAADLNGAGAAQATVVVNGEAVTLDFATGLEAVSAALTVAEVYNEFNSSPSLGGSTEWVMTMPTKRLHLASGVRPFTSVFTAQGACEPIAFGLHNREAFSVGSARIEDANGGGICFDPVDGNCDGSGPKVDMNMCWESTVLSFNQPFSAVSRSLGSRYSRNIPVATAYASNGLPAAHATRINEGWGRLQLRYDTTADGLSERRLVSLPDAQGFAWALEGLPVVGFSGSTYVNSNVGAGGALANYSQGITHKGKRVLRRVRVGAGGIVLPVD